MLESITGLLPGIGGVVGVAGAAFGIWKKRNLGKLVKEVFEFFRKYREAKDVKGRGGAEITSEELDELVKEFEDVVKHLVGVIRT